MEQYLKKVIIIIYKRDCVISIVELVRVAWAFWKQFENIL